MLTEGHGVTRTQDGKTVWFTLGGGGRNQESELLVMHLLHTLCVHSYLHLAQSVAPVTGL